MEIRRSETYKKWYRNLKDSKARNLIFVRTLRLEEGNRGDWGPVGEGLFELRIHYGPGYRVYCLEEREEIVLLCGGDKSTQQSDIIKAKRIAADFKSD